MNSRLALAALAAAGITTAAAQMGPGIMHGGDHAMKAGPGPATMGGPGGCPMGAGMMGGHMGGGMMGGSMMGGHMGGHTGGGMMGGSMMGGKAFMALDRLNLDQAQRGKVKEVLRDSQRKMHALMGSVHELRWQEEDAAKPGEFDASATRKRYEAHAAIQKQMFEARLEAHKRIQDLLTKEQREQLGK